MAQVPEKVTWVSTPGVPTPRPWTLPREEGQERTGKPYSEGWKWLWVSTMCIHVHAHTHACTHVNNVYAQRRAKFCFETRQMWVQIPAPPLHLYDLRYFLLLASPRESTLLDFCDSSVNSNTAPGTWWETRRCHVNSCSFPHLPGCWSLWTGHSTAQEKEIWALESGQHPASWASISRASSMALNPRGHTVSGTNIITQYSSGLRECSIQAGPERTSCLDQRKERLTGNPKKAESEGACVSAKSLQLCPTLCDPTDCNLPGSSVH